MSLYILTTPQDHKNNTSIPDFTTIKLNTTLNGRGQRTHTKDNRINSDIIVIHNYTLYEYKREINRSSHRTPHSQLATKTIINNRQIRNPYISYLRVIAMIS